ncbi:MAG TPA: hypothetical protein VFJ19_13650 [Nocardioidaceae bacterium]|nr:hypothetical protein [Nocardioidaceae bacterium]
MPVFALLSRRRTSPAGPRNTAELPQRIRTALPMRFEAVGEALFGAANGAEVCAACAVVGRDVARDGAALGEALSGLHATYALILGTEPEYAAIESLAVAWSEATLEYLHDLSCEDPLTGLASLAHVRTRLSEIYRDAELSDESVQTSHGLVIIELCDETPGSGPEHHFTRALRLVQVTEVVRSVYSGGQTVGRLGLDRAVVVVRREPDLGMSVSLLRDFLADLDLGAADVRVWIEGLPASADSATRLLDELAR